MKGSNYLIWFRRKVMLDQKGCSGCAAIAPCRLLRDEVELLHSSRESGKRTQARSRIGGFPQHIGGQA
jgi:hypothetical protein